MNSSKTLKQVKLADAIAEATDCIGSLYPLTNFIACNALKGFEKIPFSSAMRKATDLFGARVFLPLSEYRAMYESGRIEPRNLEEAFHRNQSDDKPERARDRKTMSVAEMLDQISGSRLVELVNKEMVKWCAAYLDRTQSQWSAREKDSLYQFWKELAYHDLSLTWHGVKDWSQSVELLPDHSVDALENLLGELELQGEQIAPYLRRHIIQLPGYASYLKWRDTEKVEESVLLDYLAIRLHYEKMLCRAVSRRVYMCDDLGFVRSLLELELPPRESESIGDDYGPVWQEAYELNYRDKLLSSLSKDMPVSEQADCQMVFCIDVRSEPIRRELEKLGPYETYGFAGFFGMPMRFNALGSAMSLDLCPVLLQPDKHVAEKCDSSDGSRKLSWQALNVSALQLKKRLKCNLVGAFGFVESFGLLSAVPLALKTFFPSQSRQIWNSLERRFAGSPVTKLDLSNFSLDEKVKLAEGTIKGIGLSYYGRLVVLCGHKSSSQNNPFASSLDCGACGGNGGGFSARLAAEILNDTCVRERLSDKRIAIPANTRFVAAEHDTTTDLFELFDCEFISEEHLEILENLKADLVTAGKSARRRRAQFLPQSGLSQLNDPLERSCDWAQVTPEWGLAGNAAFIAAPRALSKDTDLKGRAFLHSYEYSEDSNSKVLELIMSAPLVVAQWINMQYYLSTVDNKVFGSGSKVLHNVVGDFGVMQGASSDLRLGLPMQSLMTEASLMHEPMRLLAVIRAPLAAIDGVLEKHSAVRNLVANHWIRLVALDPDSAEFYEAEDCGKWSQIQSEFKSSKSEVPDDFRKVCCAK